jgi:probable phosphomutase (TIGR03848 family)
MRLYLIRHAVTAETGAALSGRQSGIPLSAAGVTMAERVAGELGHLPVRAIYSSPILRCRQTARPIGAARDLVPAIDRGLIEADYGTWTGRSLKSLYRLKAWHRLMESASRFRFPQGETLEEVQRRAVVSVEAMADRHRSDAVAAVSHADVIRVILAHYLGMPLDLVHRLSVGPASISVVELHQSGAVAVPVVNCSVMAGGAH